MQKELLLAIGDDCAASYNLRFLKEIFRNFCDLKLTLFYVAPRQAVWETTEKELELRGDALKEFLDNKESKGEKVLEDARRWISEIAGCSGDNVISKMVPSKKGTARELIDEAHSGMYDALLLGKKGFSWLENLFENSVCHELLWRDIDFPIWICRKLPDTPRHDVLLCMDGSDASLRMVDHAGYMLAEEPEHSFTLFHVAEGGFEAARSSRIFEEGLALLAEHNIDEERIELKMVTSGSTLKATLKEAEEGNYSAVGVGKRSMGEPSRMEECFPSSFTVRLLRQLTHSALWISR